MFNLIKMRRLLTSIVAYLCFMGLANSQYLELGLLLGGSNYGGELQYKTIEDREIHLSMGAFARYNMSKYLTVRVHALKTTISGTDFNANLNVESRSRNLSFESSILELGAQAELNIFGVDIMDKKGSSFYVFGGVAGFKFNPKAELNGTFHELQPLGTEGQNLSGSKYGLISIAFPFGIGAKINLSYRINIGLEMGFRHTLTDYLDDVSTQYPDLNALQSADPIAAALSYRTPELDPSAEPNPVGITRGDPSNKDRYMIGSATISYNLGNKKKLEYNSKFKW